MRGFTRLAFIAPLLAVAGSGEALAHHSFASEFDGELEGKVEGTVTKVWWANPHIRYDVDMTMPDGSVEQWSLHPPGNLPTYRRMNWTAETVQAGDHVVATGNLGRDDTKKLYATCIELESGRQLGRCVEADLVTEVSADPNVDYTYHSNEYAVDISGFWDNRYKFRTTVDDFEPKPMPMKPETPEARAPTTKATPVRTPTSVSSLKTPTMTPTTTAVTIARRPIVRYWRLRNALAPSRMVPATSCMERVPLSRRRTS